MYPISLSLSLTLNSHSEAEMFVKAMERLSNLKQQPTVVERPVGEASVKHAIAEEVKTNDKPTLNPPTDVSRADVSKLAIALGSKAQYRQDVIDALSNHGASSVKELPDDKLADFYDTLLKIKDYAQ